MKARLPKEYRGGGEGNMNQMIRKAQQVQELMAEKQAELETREFTATVGGGVVEVTITGNKQIKSMTIDPDVVDPEDVEMLQDLVMAAVNEAYRQVEETSEAEMEEITGGLSLPGMF